MRRAQHRLRGLVTMVAIAVFMALAAFTALPHAHVVDAVARIAAQQGSVNRLPPSGIRWF